MKQIGSGAAKHIQLCRSLGRCLSKAGVLVHLTCPKGDQFLRNPFTPAMHNRPIPLEELLTGQTARISRIHGSPDHVHRLEEFGLRGGTCIEMFRPGNPCIIRMAGNKICFRADDGLSISVVPIPQGD